MSRFNKRAVSIAASPPDTINKAGGQAYAQNLQQEVVGILLTSFVQDEFYRSGNATIARLAALIQTAPLSDVPFLAKATIYARTVLGMRSVTHVAAAEIAHRMSVQTAETKARTGGHFQTPEWVRRFVAGSIYRIDDAAEILSYYGEKWGKPFPHSLLRGIRDNLSERDPYQLAKYRGESKGLKLIDVVRLTHPKPAEHNAEAFAALVAGTLTSTDTWESTLTRAGQAASSDEEKVDLKNAAWASLLSEGKLGHFALLRNLRNIAQDSPESLTLALTQLVNPEVIRRSLVMPFRYSTAYREFNKLGVRRGTRSRYDQSWGLTLEPDESKGLDGPTIRKMNVALSNALDMSLANVPLFDGKTMVWLDNSGSMQGEDPKAPVWIGALFAAILAKANGADVGTFSDSATYMDYNPLDSTLTIAEKLMASSTPSGTNFHAPFEAMQRHGKYGVKSQARYDRIIILSDEQGWMQSNNYYNPGAPTKAFADYRKAFQVDPYIYSFDLRNYGTMMFNPDNPKVFMIGGFSGEIFKVMSMLEGDRNALAHEIDKIQL